MMKNPSQYHPKHHSDMTAMSALTIDVSSAVTPTQPRNTQEQPPSWLLTATANSTATQSSGAIRNVTYKNATMRETYTI